MLKLHVCIHAKKVLKGHVCNCPCPHFSDLHLILQAEGCGKGGCLLEIAY